VPAQLIEKNGHGMLEGLFAWVALLGLGICGAYIGGHFVRNARRYCTSVWNSFKYGYFLAMAVLISCMYVAYKLLGLMPFLFDSEGWYAVLYSLTIVVFGLRRIYVRPTGYIARQTVALMAFQVLLLFVIPMLVIPYMGNQGMLSDWIMTNVFPGGSYWRSFGFVLAWPLFMYNLAAGQQTVFWLILGVIQTFVIIPAIVYRWGKGAYCGWVCSCGALAETLGDEYRAKAPHGPGPKRAENSGQMVLWFAVCVTIGSLISGSGHSAAASTALEIYAFCVDIVCAGVIGLGCYFFLSGRVWCRFLCPLAALMHLYARFSVYRIFSNKKRCISCNICTRVCHMGIDVMNYANRGIPMNDVQCVRCSACVVSCPMQVLTFGKTGGTVPDKSLPGRSPVPLTRGWASGLFQKDIAMLLKEEGGTKNTDTVQ
jgi:polyferredoxin